MQKVNDIDVDLFRCFQFTGPCQSTLGTQSHIRISIAPPTTYRGSWGREKGSQSKRQAFDKSVPLSLHRAVTKFLGFISYFYDFPVHPTEIKRQCSVDADTYI